jgi:hypothetical protein
MLVVQKKVDVLKNIKKILKKYQKIFGEQHSTYVLQKKC